MTSFDSLQILWIEERCRVNEAIKFLWQANAGCTHHSLFQSSRDGAHIFLTVGLSFAGAGGKNKYSFKAAFSPSQATAHGHLTLSPVAIVGMCMVFNPISNSFGLNSRILPLGLNNYLLRYPR